MNKNFLTRTDRSIIGNWWWSVDRWLLFILGCLILLGIFLIYSGGYGVAIRTGYNPNHFVIRHVIFLVPAVFIAFFTSFLNKTGIKRLGFLMFFISMLMMLSLPVIGHTVKGATRWLRFGPLSVQPSEFVKPFFAIITAYILSCGYSQKNIKEFVKSGLILGLVLLLLFIQPDFGQMMITSAIWGSEIVVAGVPFTIITILFGFLVFGVVGMYFALPHVASRIDRFLNPAVGDTYQVDKSLSAFKNGGFWGVGAGQGTVSPRLPDSHADFIFAVAGEEIGGLFAILIIMLFAFLIIRVLFLSLKSQDLFTVLATTGLIVQLGAQSIVHMGASLGLLPAKGMTLPFLSYGGSSIVAIGFSVGMILALTKKNN
ncbi:MAG: putative lipid II flippase FtsW [Alphaproteobacteria bacterium]|jgi:cell division protein FtsW|nr:putative lipid II flippase FtsW [Alphaproteobacteria bacterium]MCV6599350.1 putative lipid II flippase FtsW [Alphaproteobacteria bacterium]